MANIQAMQGSPYGWNTGQASKMLKNNYGDSLPVRFQPYNDMRGPISKAGQTALPSGSLDATTQVWVGNFSRSTLEENELAMNDVVARNQGVFLSLIDPETATPIDDGFAQRKVVNLYTASQVNFILDCLSPIATEFKRRFAASAAFQTSAQAAVDALEDPAPHRDRFALMHGIIDQIERAGFSSRSKLVSAKLFAYAYCTRALRLLFGYFGTYINADTAEYGRVTVSIAGKNWETYGAYPGIGATLINSVLGSIIKQSYDKGGVLHYYRLQLYSSQGINMPPPRMLLMSHDCVGRLEESYFDLHGRAVEPAFSNQHEMPYLTKEQSAEMVGPDVVKAAVAFQERKMQFQYLVKNHRGRTRRY